MARTLRSLHVDDLQKNLRTYYIEAQSYPPDFRILKFSHIQAGWESDIFAFDLDLEPGRGGLPQELILRIYPGMDAHEKSQHEFTYLQLLSTAGYPVPKVFTLERENSPFERPFIIMERIPGEVLWNVLASVQEEAQQVLIESFCCLFVKLHQLDWKPFAQHSSSAIYSQSNNIVKTQLERWRAYYERFPIPDFLPVFEWLHDHLSRIRSSRPAVLHWDFHPGNVVLRSDGSMVVIDWTGLQVSDQRFDLAWTLMLITAYEGLQMRQLFLGSYQRLAGKLMEQMDFFDVAACLRRLYSIAVSITTGAERMGMRPGAEDTMQEQREPIQQVYSLLLQHTGIYVPMVENWLA